MLIQSTTRLGILLLMASFVELSDLASAQSHNPDPQPTPRLEEYETEKIKDEFLSRLKDHRSLAHRKQSVINQYVRYTNIYKEQEKEREEVASELSTLQKQYASAGTMPNLTVIRVAHLDNNLFGILSMLELLELRMSLSLEEYDVLSRIQEAEREFKNKALSKTDYRAEERQLRERLFQLRLAERLGFLEWQLSEALRRIEQKTESLKYKYP
ncbi:MAG: hypothetical protein KF747_10175 [Nitrospira sp.]|nr:hypothetical protein [Nitrospira sp.]